MFLYDSEKKKKKKQKKKPLWPFFYHKCLWKESGDLLDFLQGDNHQRKVASGTICFDWVWPVVPLVQLHFRILWAISQEEISQYAGFFAWRQSSKKGSIWDYLFWLGVVSCASCPISLQISLIISISAGAHLGFLEGRGPNFRKREETNIRHISVIYL